MCNEEFMIAAEATLIRMEQDSAQQAAVKSHTFQTQLCLRLVNMSKIWDAWPEMNSFVLQTN